MMASGRRDGTSRTQTILLLEAMGIALVCFSKCCPPSLCQGQLRLGGFLSRDRFRVRWEAEDLEKMRQATNSEASFSYIELVREHFPPTPALHSTRPLNCASKTVHGLCRLIPCVQTLPPQTSCPWCVEQSPKRRNLSNEGKLMEFIS